MIIIIFILLGELYTYANVNNLCVNVHLKGEIKRHLRINRQMETPERLSLNWHFLCANARALIERMFLSEVFSHFISFE